MTGLMRRARSLAGWFAVLVAVWLLLLGTGQSTEVYAGLGAAALTAVFAETLRTRRLFDYRVSGRVLVQAWRLPALVVYDFGLVTVVLVRALLHGRRVRGTWVRVPYAPSGQERGRFESAFGVIASNGAANALVVDVERGEALLHALVPSAPTAKSVL